MVHSSPRRKRTVWAAMSAFVAAASFAHAQNGEIATFARQIDKELPVAELIRPRQQGGDQAKLIALIFARATARYPGRNPAGLWRTATQNAYICLHQKYRQRGIRSARQSWAAASGRAFEEHVARTITTRLAEQGILAVRPKTLQKPDNAIRQSVMLRIVRPCSPTPVLVEPDNDVLLLSDTTHGRKVFGIISCKTSLHARLTESLFWAILIKRQLPLKAIFVTLDLDEEFGSCKNPTRQGRVLGETFFDMMYSLNEKTILCPKLKRFSECPNDIARWRDKMIPNARRAGEEVRPATQAPAGRTPSSPRIP